ncbi:MAG: glycosyltransferase family 4 protein [Planctomycetota bacterium]
MRIGIVHYSAPPVIGGVEFIVGAHARLFADAGHEVVVIAGEGEAFDERVQLRKVRELGSLRRATVMRLVRTGGIGRLARAAEGKLREALADCDVCICHNVLTMHFNPAAANAIAKLARSGEAKVIAWVHDATRLAGDYARLSFKGRVWDYLREAIPNVKYVAISRARRKGIAGLFGIAEREIAVVPDGVSLTRFLGITPQADRIVREEGLDDCDVVALTPTRIVRRKNLEAGVELVGELKKAGRSVRWLVTGVADRHVAATARYFEELRRMVEERGLEREVRFLGAGGERLGLSTLRSLYWLCDLVLLTSREEGFGIPVLEAGLSGRLVVVSDIPAFRELAREDTIYLGTRADPAVAGREILEHLAGDKPTRLRKRVLRRYTWRNIFKRKLEPLVVRAAGGEKREAKKGLPRRREDTKGAPSSL